MRSVENSESTISTVMRVWRICCSSERCTLNLYKRTYACDTCLTAQPHTVPLVQPPTLALPNAEAEARPEETNITSGLWGAVFLRSFLRQAARVPRSEGGSSFSPVFLSFFLRPFSMAAGRSGPRLHRSPGLASAPAARLNVHSITVHFERQLATHPSGSASCGKGARVPHTLTSSFSIHSAPGRSTVPPTEQLDSRVFGWGRKASIFPAIPTTIAPRTQRNFHSSASSSDARLARYAHTQLQANPSAVPLWLSHRRRLHLVFAFVFAPFLQPQTHLISRHDPCQPVRAPSTDHFSQCRVFLMLRGDFFCWIYFSHLGFGCPFQMIQFSSCTCREHDIVVA